MGAKQEAIENLEWAIRQYRNAVTSCYDQDAKLMARAIVDYAVRVHGLEVYGKESSDNEREEVTGDEREASVSRA